MKMSLIAWSGTCAARMLRRQPGPKSKKKRSPFPSSTQMQVAAWSRLGGNGHEPMNVIRISSGPSSSDVGK